jgi:hypothetical protein
LEAAICWAKLLNHVYHDSTSVLTAFGAALDLLTSIAGLEQTVQHRYTMVGDFLNIPAEAAATAFRLGRPDVALEWLEQGRCLVWGQQSQLRTPLDALHALDQALADQIVSVSSHLENMGSSRRHSGTEKSWEGKVSLEDEALKHSHLASERDVLITRVRSIPGFKNFLKPLQCSTIHQHLPESGPVVILNAHKGRCDAIVLLARHEVPIHIHLSDFSLTKAKQYRHVLNTRLHSHHLRAQHANPIVDGLISERAAGQYGRSRGVSPDGIYLVLGGLWNEVVRPVLDVLRLAVSGLLSYVQFPMACLLR